VIETTTNLGTCICCGCQFGIKTYVTLVSVGCDTEIVGPRCSNYEGCKPEDCLIDDPAIIEKQMQEARKLLEIITSVFNKEGKVLLLFANEPTLASIEFFKLADEAGWLYGKIEESKPIHSYYRLFPNEREYKIAFITAYVEGFQEIDDRAITEFKRLGISVDKVKISIVDRKMLDIESYHETNQA